MSMRRSTATADRQATALIDAMHDIGRRLERRRAALSAAHDARRRDALRDALAHDLDRLSNLVSLAETVPSVELAPVTVRELDDSVRILRGRMKHIGLQMAIERLHELHASARDWTRSGTHPLGKSLHLRAEFIRYVSYLRSMSNTLSTAHCDMLADALDAINALIQNDRHSSWLRSFADDEPIALLDRSVVDFDIDEEFAVAV